jgi:hypothetical protein
MIIISSLTIFLAGYKPLEIISLYLTDERQITRKTRFFHDGRSGVNPIAQTEFALFYFIGAAL